MSMYTLTDEKLVDMPMSLSHGLVDGLCKALSSETQVEFIYSNRGLGQIIIGTTTIISYVICRKLTLPQFEHLLFMECRDHFGQEWFDENIVRYW